MLVGKLEKAQAIKKTAITRGTTYQQGEIGLENSR